jgi:hypothetical protein
MPTTSPANNVLLGTANIFNALDAFMTNNSIDVMYKAVAFVLALFGLYFIPATRGFALWAAAAILLLLMIQSSPTDNLNPATPYPLPMPTQINTPDPTQGASSGSSGQQQQGGGGFNPLSLLPLILSSL